MKKFIIAIVSCAAIAAGCTKESAQIAEPTKLVTFDASTDAAKSNLDGLDVKWQKNDFLAIYDGSVNEFIYNTETQKFQGTANTSAAAIYAVYPHLYANGSTPMRFTAGTEETDPMMSVKTFIPSCQKPVANSFCQGANLSAGKVSVLEDGNLVGTMYNLCGFIKFTISQASTTPIVKVRISSPELGRKLSGLGTVKFNSETDVEAVGEENNYVEVMPIASDPVIGNGTYVACVYPAYVKNEGLLITMIGQDGSVYEFKTKGFDLKRNKMYNLGTIDSSLATDKTTKLCILADFASGNTDLATTAPGTTEKAMEVTMGANTYNMYIKGESTSYPGPKNSGSYALMKGGYFASPALPGKTLESVVITWKSHTTNLRPKVTVLDIDSYTVSGHAISGRYWCKNGNLTYADIDNSHCLPNMGGTTVSGVGSIQSNFISHYFKIGQINWSSEANPGGTMVTPAANTKYYVWDDGAANLVEAVEMIFN